ncbi:MAG: hypothetical protein A2186_01540 [Candidatus Levybacteria bacterium RIFOXYA1_FULL_41_10]|nr:MAG: hypothetical protein UT44_C0003G0005 [Candidatus Levybacteria bacterium GW2011_GWA1_39_32]KKR51492.1 MAG: hypothetical protein UT87_C0005G0028 [Candidatus Levybacteria bacterium GW2011_GWC1_40_19]KKR95443.1 MAG: hypothetical protein UU45_C0001G0038 [Candidatus Levybacteria bacterium GW2011_GWA2_41_15]KKS01928.1 MAG: hypothetical protein UU52_C0005G0037 [Candidatus Levybacteria bacterium GW2011_GWB1_41_21]OGH20843.1 MAG: hypothetical protein A2695_00620 [Candidatus Levybacteria bacterium
MDTPKIPKTLEESPRYKQNIKKINKNTKALDVHLVGATFTIACKADEYPLLDAFGTRSIKIDGQGKIPPITIYFKEFEEKIVLLDVEETPEIIS